MMFRNKRSQLLASIVAAIAATFLVIILFPSNNSEKQLLENKQIKNEKLASDLAELRGRDDLVRKNTEVRGVRPKLYSTAYARNALLASGSKSLEELPDINSDSLIRLVENNSTNSPAWRGYYTCLTSRTDNKLDPSRIIQKAGIHARVIKESINYLKNPTTTDSVETKITTYSAFIQTMDCLGRHSKIPESYPRKIIDLANSVNNPIVKVFARDALRKVYPELNDHRNDRINKSFKLPRSQKCDGMGSMFASAAVLLTETPSDELKFCAKAGMKNSDPQVRWMSARAVQKTPQIGFTEIEKQESAVSFADSGLVLMLPDQLGTIRGNYKAARSLAAAGALDKAPKWLIDSTKKAAQRNQLPASEKLAVAMVCERLEINCFGLRERGKQIARKIPVPKKATRKNLQQWIDAMTARFEFGLDCPRTEVRLPDQSISEISHPWLHALELLGQLDCDQQLRRMTDTESLISRTHKAIDSGNIIAAAHSWYAAILSGADTARNASQSVHMGVQDYRVPKSSGLFSATPGGTPDIDATLAGYTLLGLTAP
ncbi:hypothetical protein [Actinopolyspora alba]|nr:hypothetical protein [Actinopolyspora alba]